MSDPDTGTMLFALRLIFSLLPLYFLALIGCSLVFLCNRKSEFLALRLFHVCVGNNALFTKDNRN